MVVDCGSQFFSAFLQPYMACMVLCARVIYIALSLARHELGLFSHGLYKILQIVIRDLSYSYYTELLSGSQSQRDILEIPFRPSNLVLFLNVEDDMCILVRKCKAKKYVIKSTTE